MICNVCVAPKIWQKGVHNRGSGGEIPSYRRPRGSGGVAANEFLRFSHKTLILVHFFIEKGLAMMQSLWTVGVARNFERGGGHNFHFFSTVNFSRQNKFEADCETRKALGGPGACCPGKCLKIYML